MSSRKPDRKRNNEEEASRRKPSGKELLGNHQRSWIWGKHLVQETIAGGRWPVLELCVSEHLSSKEVSAVLKNGQGIDPAFVNSQRLKQLCGSEDHQGWIARVGPYPYVEIEELLSKQPANPFWLLVEGIQDPFNLGTILRSAEVFSVTGVCLGKKGQTGINSLAARSSVGAVNRLDIAQVDELEGIIQELKRKKVTVVGTSLQATSSLDSIDCQKGIAIVIGNEGRGVSEETLKVCSRTAKIPQTGTLNSLNAAAAAAIACYEVQRQRRATKSRS